MFVANVKTEDEEGIVAIFGLTFQDMAMAMNGQPFPLVDLRRNFEFGNPLPSAIQLVCGFNHEAIVDRLVSALPDLDREYLMSLDPERGDADDA